MKTTICSYLSVLILLFGGASCFSQAGSLFIAPRYPALEYEGRVDFSKPGRSVLYWAGSSVKIIFRGASITADLKDDRGYNFFNVVVDDSVVQILKIDTSRKTYVLAAGLSEGMHRVELFKRTDGKRGGTSFFGFTLSPGSKIRKPAARSRSIEFYGNSVTVGSGIEEGDFPGGDEDNYRSYAAVTARHFKAHYTCIARSGIGLMVSWFSLIMPEMYNRLNPDDSSSQWDFKRSGPRVVVIDLFQNDCALLEMPEDPQFKKRFGDQAPSPEFIIHAYRDFLGLLRRHYPLATIICTLGNMDAVKPGSRWPGYIEKAVASTQDKNIYTHFFAYKNTPDHPNTAEQQQMADSLINFIEDNISW